jgi:hypothetical protein
MKHRLILFMASMMMLIFMALSGACAFTLVTPDYQRPPRHHRRYVWVQNVYYEQVYYVDGSHHTIIVSQKEIPHKKPKPRHGHGRNH